MRILFILIISICTLDSGFAKNLELKGPFANKARIPIEFTCDGKNISPMLKIANVPPNTKSFVLILYNPDAPYGIYYNWVVYNIPSTVTLLPEGFNIDLPEGVVMGKTSSGDVLYRGPCPPNSALHHYIFKLYALNTMLNLEGGVEAEELLARIKRHIIEEAELVGVFSH